MYKLIGNPVESDPVDISMSEAASWPAVPGLGDCGFHALLMGDQTAGPYLAIVAIPPRTEPLPLFPAHGHGTDTWRITLRGEMNMGARKYLPGEFRYQAGNKPYGSDDLAWGPDWGFSIVMMADRRGTPSFPPDRDPEKMRRARVRTKPLFDWLGIHMVEDYAEPQGVATTLEAAPRSAKAEGTFSDTAGWPEVTPGTRVAIGMLGERDVGPVLLHVHADAGQVAYPASHFDTEVLHIAVSGSTRIGDRELKAGDLRLVGSATPAPDVVAGPEGFCETIVFGDRRSVTPARIQASGLPGEWKAFLATSMTELGVRLNRRLAAPAA